MTLQICDDSIATICSVRLKRFGFSQRNRKYESVRFLHTFRRTFVIQHKLTNIDALTRLLRINQADRSIKLTRKQPDCCPLRSLSFSHVLCDLQNIDICIFLYAPLYSRVLNSHLNSMYYSIIDKFCSRSTSNISINKQSILIFNNERTAQILRRFCNLASCHD